MKAGKGKEALAQYELKKKNEMKYLKNCSKGPQEASCDGQTLPTLRSDEFLHLYSQHLAQNLI